MKSFHWFSIKHFIGIDHHLAFTQSHRLLLNGIAGGSLLLFPGCSGGTRDEDSSSDNDIVSESTAAELEREMFVAGNDIGMAVRSVADAINVGERLDSTEYQFSGVLTDGSGMPLFTDFSGLPGQWQIEVVAPDMVKIRNTNPGDLLPEELVAYLAESLSVADRTDVKLVEEKEEGDSSISVFSFGKGNLRVTTRPFQLKTGEIGPLMEITLQADSVCQPKVPTDSVSSSPLQDNIHHPKITGAKRRS